MFISQICFLKGIQQCKLASGLLCAVVLIYFKLYGWGLPLVILPTKDFVDKAYPDSPPVKPPQELQSFMAAQMVSTPVRNTHASLVDSTVSLKKTKKNTLNDQTLEHLVKLLEKAKQMDQSSSFANVHPHETQAKQSSIAELGNLSFLPTLSRSSSSLSVVASPQNASEQPAAEPAKAEDEKPSAGPSVQQEPLEVEPKAGSLEDYEKQAFQQLHSKMKRPVLKRPSACVTTGSATAGQSHSSSAVAASKAGSKKPRLTCWGCIRCRGNVHGCDSCAFEGFGGMRLNGREQWHKYMKGKGK